MTEIACLPRDEARERARPAASGPAALPTAASAIDGHLVALRSPSSFDAEPYRILVSTLERVRGPRPCLAVAVTSAAPGDGKTTTAINLAAVLARRPACPVLLVDADLRRPAVAQALGLGEEAGPGLVRVLEDLGALAGSVRGLGPALPLSVLPAGRPSGLAHETLASAAFAIFMERVREAHRYVILDTPPAVALPDARALAHHVDGFLLVVRAGATPRRLVGEALEALGPEKVIGLVWNGDERPLAGYYGRYRSYYASTAARD
jgi:Mrp family chromosome partitioning ATPase